MFGIDDFQTYPERFALFIYIFQYERPNPSGTRKTPLYKELSKLPMATILAINISQ